MIGSTPHNQKASGPLWTMSAFIGQSLMGELNAKRELPYNFKVFEMDGAVYLFDDSSREYPCTPQPHVYIEALYWVDGECEEPCDYTGYLLERDFATIATTSLELDPEDVTPDIEDRVAWDTARDEAHCNHYI